MLDDQSEWDTDLINRFRQHWWERGAQTFWPNRWAGVWTQQCPLDVWVTQEIIWDTRPEVFVETGTKEGGSALVWQTFMRLVNDDPEVITVDVDPNSGRGARGTPGITFVIGSSADPDTADRVRELVGDRRAMVLLDSDHTTEHVAAELELFAPLVSSGCYLVVQDSFLGGHPVDVPEYGSEGPWPAIRQFVSEHPEFTVDKTRERMMLTMCTDGYLRRR